MRVHLTIPSVTLILGSFLCDTRILFYLIVNYNIRYSSWIEQGFFYACTLMQLLCLIMYLCMRPIKHFSHYYEFIFVPLFSISFLNKQVPFQSNKVVNALRITLFILGWVISLVMVITQYTRYPQDENEALIKISTNLRIIKLIKRLAFALLAGFNILHPLQLTFFFMIGLTMIQCYCFITTFSFQNPFHQYLLMLATFSSLISWIDFALFYQGITNYAFIGQILFILIIIISPQIIQKALEMKYEIYGEKNIDTQKINELLAVFVVMKEIVLNQRHSLKYTSDFQNKIFTLLQKMVAKHKILSQTFDETNMLREKDYLSEDQLNFLKVLQRRLRQNQQFIAYEFYLTTIVRKGFNFKNKALAIYYQRVSDKGKVSTNLFNKIEMKMLYQHLMNQLQQKGKNEIHHGVLKFSDSLSQLKTRIMNLCKHQISMVNLFQNSSNVPIQRYSGELIERHQLKLKIKQQIDQLNTNQWHIHSGTFLYICLLYKIIFERQQIIIGEKINKNFVIPLAHQSRKSKFLISQYRNISIFVFSSKQKGLILNENQYFSKTYGRTVRSAQKSKKYISQLFLSLKQRIKHQDLIQSSTKYQGLQIHDHSTYDCWIRRRIILKNDKFNDQQRLISIVQKVKISARIYYQEQQSQAFICTIQQKDCGIETKFLAKDLQTLKKYDIKFQITGQQTLQQLDQKVEIFSIVNKSYDDDSFMQNQMSQEQSQANISQNLMFLLDFQSIQHKKIEKIQKQYDKEAIKFDPRRKIIVFLIFLPILSFFVSQILSLKINSLIRQSKEVMQYEKQIFEKTLINEKFVGLNLMLYQMVVKDRISNSMCESFGVDSLKKYTVENLLKFANNNFDEIQLTQIQGVDGNDQLQQIFNSRYYQFFEFKDQQIWMNYVMYGSLTKSRIFEYATLQGEKNFDEWSQIAITKAINVSELSYDGLFSHLRLKFSQIKQNLQQTINYSLMILYIVWSLIFLVVLFTFYRLIGFKYNHILLLRDFRKNYVKERVRQMDFILSQMTRLQKNQIYDIQIDKLMNLKMTRQNQQQCFTLQQFEKQSFIKVHHEKTMQESSNAVSLISSVKQLQEQKQYLVQGNQTLKQRNQTAPIMIMFSFHKYKVLGLLVFFIVSGTLNVLDSQLLKEKTMKIFLMEDLFNDMGLLLIGMQDLLVGEVVKYKGEQIYASHDLNELWIRLDIDQLYYNKFQQKVYELFPKQIEDVILYQSYCHRALNKAYCQKLKGGVLTNGLSSLVGLLRKDYNSTWDKAYSSDIIQQRQICQKIIIFTNFTINQYQANLIEGYNNLQSGFTDQQNNLKIADGIVSFFLIIGIGIVGEIIVGRGRKVRAQVLSMDTKINLYKQQQSYRTLLNTMFYKQQKDIVF